MFAACTKIVSRLLSLTIGDAPRLITLCQNGRKLQVFCIDTQLFTDVNPIFSIVLRVYRSLRQHQSGRRFLATIEHLLC